MVMIAWHSSVYDFFLTGHISKDCEHNGENQQDCDGSGPCPDKAEVSAGLAVCRPKRIMEKLMVAPEQKPQQIRAIMRAAILSENSIAESPVT